MYNSIDIVNELITLNEFIVATTRKFTEDEIFSLRATDFEDIAIEANYKYQDFKLEDEDVEFNLKQYVSYVVL